MQGEWPLDILSQEEAKRMEEAPEDADVNFADGFGKKDMQLVQAKCLKTLITCGADINQTIHKIDDEEGRFGMSPAKCLDAKIA